MSETINKKTPAQAEGFSNGTADKYRILIIEEHSLLRSSIACLVSSQPHLEVCGKAATGTEAFALLADHDPDLVVIDLDSADVPGIELVAQVHRLRPDVGIVVLTAYDTSPRARRSQDVGARAIVGTRDSSDSLLLAIDEVLAGGVYPRDPSG